MRGLAVDSKKRIVKLELLLVRRHRCCFSANVYLYSGRRKTFLTGTEIIFFYWIDSLYCWVVFCFIFVCPIV